jgi:hypothetical protein
MTITLIVSSIFFGVGVALLIGFAVAIINNDEWGQE